MLKIMKTWTILMVLFLSACGGPDFEGEEPVCDAGRMTACVCSSGDEGSQTCAADGAKWETCSCVGSDPDGGTPTVTTVGPGEACDGVATVCGAFAQCLGECISDRGGDCEGTWNCSGVLKCGEDLRCTDKPVIPLDGVCGGPNDLCEAPGECWLLEDAEEPRCVVR